MQRTKSSYVGKGMICNIHEGIVNEQLRSFNPYLYLEGKARTSLRYQRGVSSQFVDCCTVVSTDPRKQRCDGAFSVFRGLKVGVSGGLLTGKTLTLALALRVQWTLPRLPICASTIHCCFTRNSYAQTIDYSSVDFLRISRPQMYLFYFFFIFGFVGKNIFNIFINSLFFFGVYYFFHGKISKRYFEML